MVRRSLVSDVARSILVCFALGVAVSFAPACGNTDAPTSDKSDEHRTDASGGDAGRTDVDGDTPPDVAPVGVPSDIETELLTQNPRVGEGLKVDCKLLDQHGERITPEKAPTIVYVYSPREAIDHKKTGELIPIETGDAQIGCSAPQLSLVDETPVEFEIAPGPPHTVRTHLDKNKVTAGTTVQATCRVFDEYGNEIDDAESTVGLDAKGAGIDIKDKKITVEKADIYRATCHVESARREVGATLEVTPGLPDQISMSPVPKKSVYGLGEVVRMSTVVADQYGNEIRDASVDYTVTPMATSFGRARWEFNKEGTYTAKAVVKGMTKGGKKLTASEQIVVNGDGPAITCKSPSDGSMVDARPGGSVKFTGTVKDAHGVSKLTVNGNTVSIGRTGSFSTALTSRYGINFVDITATDKLGEENSTTCAFLLAEKWANPNDYLSDAVSLRLAQEALDDGTHTSLLDSLGDILDQVLNSTGLINQLDSNLLSSNPLKPYSKDGCLAFVCHKSSVDYIRAKGGGPGLRTGNNTVSLDWIPNGIDVGTRIDDFSIRLKIDSNVCGTVRGWLDVDYIDVDMKTDIRLKNGQPTASYRPGTLNVNVGNINPNFSGACGTLANFLQGILQDTMQQTLEGELRDLIKNNVNSILHNLFSSLDISSVNSRFDVPSFDGSSTVPVDFNLRFSTLGVSNARALIGIGTKFSTPTIKNTSPSKGIPLPDGKILLDPNTRDAAAVTVHVGVLNHVLHTLWRGGMFDAAIGPSLLGSAAPSGTKATLSMSLPPVARLRGSGNVELMLGGATLKLVYPGLFDKPVDIQVGLVARTGVKLKNGDTLEFQNIKLKEFYFSPQGISLDSNSRAVIEAFLEDLFQDVVDQSLNSGLPALPIPSFSITSTLARYGLPAGKEIGIKSPSLGGTTRHFILEGSFGVK